ncbi:hypothetical protein EV14_0686 [Prochlorococcus sp. MIT 0703]|nr:hypothetical protein EV12_0708 [Prochlorococcus sp. MIT 0701]KGG35893.1 hypothetical protein EV14_0686 [Prochlorococcus sp. MIT 0703]
MRVLTPSRQRPLLVKYGGPHLAWHREKGWANQLRHDDMNKQEAVEGSQEKRNQ